jgi:hypothetical protein
MIRVRHQQTMLVYKCRLCFLELNLVETLILPVFFGVPIEAQFCHFREVYR